MGFDAGVQALPHRIHRVWKDTSVADDWHEVGVTVPARHDVTM
jgi:hypothetical protein